MQAVSKVEEELRRNSGIYKALSSPPLLDVIRDVGSLVLPKGR